MNIFIYLRTVVSTLVNFALLFRSLDLSFKIMNFQFHIIASVVCFDSYVWTQNPDITRARYEHFHFLMCSGLQPPQLCILLHVSRLEFQNHDFSIPYNSYCCQIRFAYLNTKVWYHTSQVSTFSFPHALWSMTSSTLHSPTCLST